MNGSDGASRAVDDRDGRHADAAGDADLLVALEQRVVEAAVGVHLALQDRVLDAAPAQVEHVALELRDAGLERLLRRQRAAIIGEQAVDPARRRLRRLAGDLPAELVDLRLEAEHLRMLGLHELALLLILGLKLRELLPKRLDGWR